MNAEVRSDVEEICSVGRRPPGSDAERRLANRIAEKLEGPQRTARVEPIHVQPQWAVVHFLHCAIAVAGSVVAAREPAVGFAMVLFAATSAYLDLSARHYLLRRLLFRRASQNVHSRANAGDAGSPRVIVCANLDAPRTGAVYNRLPMRTYELAARHLPVAASPTRLWFWSIALLLPVIGARMAGVDAEWLSILQLPQTLVLIVALFALGEIALSPPGPGANANASGVAAVLELVRRLDADPPTGLAVDVVACGGGETTMQGMRAFLRSHRDELRAEDVRFLSLESVGRGEPRYLVSQGLAVSLPMDPEMIRSAQAIVLASTEDGSPSAEVRDGLISAAWVARAYGHRALALTCREEGRALPEGHHTPADLPETVRPEAVEAAVDFAEHLIRLLDRDLGRSREQLVTTAA